MSDPRPDDAGPESSRKERSPWLPPRWFVRVAWVVHRALYRITAGKYALRTVTPKLWGMLRLTVVGRRTGKERNVILAYIEDGPDLVLMPMNGWADPEPAWWLNLQAHPQAVVEMPKGERRTVTARLASDDERARLWPAYARVSKGLDGYATRRSRETKLVILEPVRSPADSAA